VKTLKINSLKFPTINLVCNSVIYALDLPYCSAPEVALREGDVSSAIDIWSLGCIIIEMANKSPPWSNIAKTKEDVISILKTTQGKPILKLITKFPRNFQVIFRKKQRSFYFYVLTEILQKELPLKNY